METQLAYSTPSRRDWTPTSCVAANIETNGPNMTRFPIVTMPQSKTTRLCEVLVGECFILRVVKAEQRGKNDTYLKLE